MRLPRHDGTYTPMETVHNSRVKKVRSVSLEVTIDKSIDSAGRDNVHEVIKILHHEEFSRVVFKRFVKRSRDSELIAEMVINENDNI